MYSCCRSLTGKRLDHFQCEIHEIAFQGALIINQHDSTIGPKIPKIYHLGIAFSLMALWLIQAFVSWLTQASVSTKSIPLLTMVQLGSDAWVDR